jgi:hypothetical protein
MAILLKSIVESFYEDEESVPTKSSEDLEKLIPLLVNAAQSVYDGWDQSDPENDELGGGGICHLIADEISSVLYDHGIEATTVDAQCGEQHVWAIAKLTDGIFEVDISPNVYETGGGYTWQKIPSVQITPNDIMINHIDSIDKWNNYTSQF